MKVGLFFGSYNPIHIGHLIIAEHMVEYSDLDEVWMVVSPHNPHKKKASLLDDHHRLRMVQIAVEHNLKLRASDIEFKLPQPSYTIHTLTYLKEKFPQHEFNLIMGGDNLVTFHKWLNYEEILKHHKLYVYPRRDKSQLHAHEDILLKHQDVIIRVDAPLLEISSSHIREAIQSNKSIQYLLSPDVLKYLDEMNFYK